ncbi:hypothetical protein PoB_001328200 [Plakobranchus ocellatus]|uniref:Secreted protein n=1 Tax=Plakobranchus ocellatus TaxID=259542 RepID=A0AAV3YV08_9GAST|nr:hypothetical protein PoB_001328200 [Plakobranchus ocellatus]
MRRRYSRMPQFASILHHSLRLCHAQNCPILYGITQYLVLIFRGIGSTVASECTLRCAGTFLSKARAPPPVPWPDGEPKSLTSPCCGLAICKKPNQTNLLSSTSPAFISVPCRFVFFKPFER